MRWIRKFFYLPSSQRNLLGKTILLVGIVRLGLWLLPFRTVRYLLGKAIRRNPQAWSPTEASINRVVSAVRIASRYVPESSCLTQALAAQTLLVRHGCPAQLRIGVARSETGALQAHAWVEYRERIVIGGTDSLLHYIPLPPVDGKSL